MATGIIKKWMPDKGRTGIGYITPDDGSQEVKFYGDNLKGSSAANLKAGIRVEYELRRTAKEPTTWSFSIIGAESEPQKQAVHSALPRGYRFLNPYNFVRYLPEPDIGSDAPVAAHLMGRCPPPPHDRWVGLTGKIECHAEAVTPVFVSDTEDVVEGERQHRTYRFFNIDGKKAIPASSLRGAVRSLFEAATNSCFANFAGEKRLSYRLDTRDARRLVPARIEPLEDGRWTLRLLTGTAELNAQQPPKELYAAPVRQYKARKPTGRRPKGPPPPPVALNGLGDPLSGQQLNKLGPAAAWHGKECWAVLLKVKFPPSWRVIAVAANEAEAQRLKQEHTGNFRSELNVKQGWLCLTNQNADNKHSERFFFVQGKPILVPLPDPVRQNYIDLIQDYQDRHETAVKKRKKPGLLEGDDVALSRFVLNRDERELSEEGGELVYAMLHGRAPNLRVEFIAPVSVPRVAYNHTIGQLLHDQHLQRCKSEDALCPACRTFGWVRGENKEGAYAGRIRFSHGHLVIEKPQGPMSLDVLGSPKPTTTRFYLVAPDGKPRKGQEDPVIGYDGNNGRNRLRGRKFYRYYQPDPKQLNIPPEKCSDQNRTIQDPEGPGATFTFTITFENLAPAELGALLWTLEVGGQGYLRLGYGKPLGLGSLLVKVEEVRLRDMKTRYLALNQTGWHDSLSTEEPKQLVLAFQKGMAWLYASPEIKQEVAQHGDDLWSIPFGDLPNIKDLLAIVGRKEPNLPVHYPFSQDEFLPGKTSNGKFEWFVGNKRLKGPKWELALATEDKGLPLIDKQGNEH